MIPSLFYCYPSRLGNRLSAVVCAVFRTIFVAIFGIVLVAVFRVVLVVSIFCAVVC